MALSGNGVIHGPIRMQEARFEVERGVGEATTDEGRIKGHTLRVGAVAVFQ
jgi:hypothetical protein